MADDAILLARKFKPRLAILDMRMQGKSGMDVARYLRRQYRDRLSCSCPPLAMPTSSKRPPAWERSVYLVKPLDVRQIGRVRAALGRWEEIKAARPW